VRHNFHFHVAHPYKERKTNNMAQKTVIIHRNSKNGQIVTPEYVKRHPATTETERRTVNVPKK